MPAARALVRRVARRIGEAPPLAIVGIAWLIVMVPLVRRCAELAAVLLSGVIMELTLLPLAASADYRYSHWMIVCTVIGVVALTARRARGQV